MTTDSLAQFQNVPLKRRKDYSFGMKETDAEDIEAAINEGKNTLDQVTELRDAIMNEIAALKRTPSTS